MALVLYCATGNQGKLREFRQAAGDGVEIRPYGPLPCPETGATFEANAVQKALCYGKSLAEGLEEAPLVFADDSGLVVDALGGAPGVLSARFAGEGAADEANNALLLEKLRGVPDEGRTARFVGVIALARGSQPLAAFHGAAEGRIVHEPEGAGGFGYDPLFYFPPRGVTFASLTAAEKWRHSHRGQAFRKMLDWLRRDP